MKGKGARQKISRREMLGKGATMAAGVLAAGVAGGAMPQIASAKSGDPVLVGQTAVLDSSAGGTIVPTISAQNIGSLPGTIAIYGESASFHAVMGMSSTGAGTFGVSGSGVGAAGKSTSSHGVYGQSSSGRGVFGNSTSGPGVYGTSTNEDGVAGRATANLKSGVFGDHPGYGWGVYGRSAAGIGTYGGSTNGTGVKAASPDGIALHVDGVAKFSQAARAYVSAGVTERLINGAKVGPTSAIVVTLNGDAGPGVYVKYAVRTTSTQFKVVFSAATTKATYCSWFVLN